MSNSFTIGKGFFRNGEPVKLISGALHYFRVVPEYWRDRLEKLAAMGCNTVETYLPWNLHEGKKGVFDFAGMADAEAFIRLAGELGLMVIARPGPYICGEWEFGGLPAWLLAEDGIRLRSRHESFMRHLREYFAVLLPKLIPLQIDRGGPIIMMQVENEYGYFGDDVGYMLAVRDLLLEHGVTVPLMTSDGPLGNSLACGSVQGALPTANFGSNALERSPLLRSHLDGRDWMSPSNAAGSSEGLPELVAEFWVGWFDHWGSSKHSTAPAGQNAADLDEILRRGSVNFYMWHGGTNFGFMNGSNYYDELTPDVTSYDYDAPLSEDGQITPKYEALREIIARHAPVSKIEFTTKITRAAYGKAEVAERVSLFATLEKLTSPTESLWPLSMEKLGQGYGYTLYTSRVDKGRKIEKLRLLKTNDRVNIFVNGQRALTLYDRQLLEEWPVDWDIGGGLELCILCENMGRVNFGARMDDQRKGIDGSVLLDSRAHSGWRCYPLELDAEMVAKVDYSVGWKEGDPGFHRIPFHVDAPGDTFLELEGWGKGCVFLNGFNLGRFWDVGPQKRLYIPAPLLKTGNNELVVFESEGKAAGFITFHDVPDLGPVE